MRGLTRVTSAIVDLKSSQLSTTTNGFTQVYTTWSLLITHNTNFTFIYLGEKPYSCEICGLSKYFVHLTFRNNLLDVYK